MSEKNIKVRLQQKHDTSANWALATNFKPKAGELIIYDDLKKMKVGDGETLVNNLPFLSADVSQDLNNYVNLAGTQTISGAKTFTGTNSFTSAQVTANFGIKGTAYNLSQSNTTDSTTAALVLGGTAAGSATTTYKVGAIANKGITLTLPTTAGTFATQEYVTTQIGNIDTLLTALNSGTGV